MKTESSELDRLRDRLRLLADATTAFADTSIDHRRLLATISKSLVDVVGDLEVGQLLAAHAASAVANAPWHHADEDRFRGLVESAPDALVLVDQTGRISLVNHRAEELFGYPREELLGQSIETLVPGRYRDTHRSRRQGYAANRRARAMGSGMELSALRKDGTEFPVEISLAPVEAENGPLVCAAIRDMTERRRADEQRYRLAAIVDSSDDAIIGKTLDGIVTSWNPGAERLFGYTSAEMIGNSIAILLPPGNEDDENRILQRLRRGEVDRFDSVRRKKNGQLVDVAITSSPVLDARGNLVGASKVARDITASKQAMTELARARETAEALSRELEWFSYSVAHDLRAPLRGISGFAQMLLDDHSAQLDVEGKEWLDEVVASARRMGELIDALLSLSRLARSPIERSAVDLSALARAAEQRLSKAEPDRRVTWAIQEDLHARIDPALARDLVDNLVGNAWKFTAKATSARIEIGAADTEHGRAFFVRDNGAGFDMAYASKLFAPFQRLHTVTEFPGTGVGLASVQRIVHRHGGRVWAEGKVDRGATFFFTLPASEATEAST